MTNSQEGSNNKTDDREKSVDVVEVDIHDRIADAYYGKMGKRFQEETQRRIHWVCEQVRGDKVLDVGCSQGIVPLLLAREGKKVIGIDIDPKAIQYARELIGKEREKVRKNVVLLNEDFLEYDFEGQKFDTVIMAEVLEHLLDPERFVEKAHALIVDGGRIVVTVPFGINDFIDHKRTYYLYGPYRLLFPWFDISEIKVFGHWIGFVGTRRERKESLENIQKRVDMTQLIELAEEGFFNVERPLRERINGLLEEIKRTENKARELEKKNVSLVEMLNDLKKAHEENERKIKDNEVIIKKLKNNIVAQEEEKKKLHNELQRKQDEYKEVYDKHFLIMSQLQVTKKELEIYKKEKKKDERKLSNYEVKLNNLKKAYIEKESIISALKARYIEKEELINQIKNKMYNSEKEYNKLVKLYLRQKDYLNQIQLSLNSLLKEAGNLRRKLKEKENKVAKKDSLIFELTKDYELLSIKYDTLTENYKRVIEEYNKVKSEFMEKVNILENTNNILKQELDNYRKNISNMEKRMADIESVRKKENLDLKSKIEKLSKDNINLKMEIQKTRYERDSFKRDVEKVKNTISFQLGYALIHNTKSIRGIMTLPKVLWRIYKEARARKNRKNLKVKEVILSDNVNVIKNHELRGIDKIDDIKKLRVACIMDEFTYKSYLPECNLLQLSYKDWRREIEKHNPDLLFIESAWQGKNGEWRGKVAHRDIELIEIVKWCKEKNIPTVFWNKEDPVHFETFINTAKLFDYVFTTDIDCIHRYKEALKHDRIYLLPFACQPEISNPIEEYERKNAFCFAGAYYARYPHRNKDLLNLMHSLKEKYPIEIYDRNYYKNEEDYKFPEEFSSYIVGNLPFDKIDIAYKGYKYAINMNSIKFSQSMFARRVYELLGSNTLTVSNYSRGMRILFGDLIVSSDNGEEVLKRVEAIEKNKTLNEIIRLNALRKVMYEHTYQDRLSYILSKISNKDIRFSPKVMIISLVSNEEELRNVVNIINAQTYTECDGYVVFDKSIRGDVINIENAKNIKLISKAEAKKILVSELMKRYDYFSAISPSDYYGENYIKDLVIGARYSKTDVIGKKTYFSIKEENVINIENEGNEYKYVEGIPYERALVNTEINSTKDVNLYKFVKNVSRKNITGKQVFSIDKYNYCKNISGKENAIEVYRNMIFARLPVNYDNGMELHKLICYAEKIEAPKTAEVQGKIMTGKELFHILNIPKDNSIKISVDGNKLNIDSKLNDGVHQYIYAKKDFLVSELGYKDKVRLYFDVTPGLNIQFVMLFLDKNKNRIGHIIKLPNRNFEEDMPEETRFIRLGLRIYSGGMASVNSVIFGHRSIRPGVVIGKGENLVLTNHYPSYDDLYRNAFVHTRVLSYKEKGVFCDVFRFRSNEALSYHEFQAIDVITGGEEILKTMLKQNNHKNILVHFLDEYMWSVLKEFEDKNIYVWLHGAEIQPWHRREYNYTTPEEKEKAKRESDKRMKFWRGLLKDMPKNMKLVFVSQYFADEVMEDLGFRIPEESYKIIHNPIDTELFSYEEKPLHQRKKILSIRPYASRTYANDLSVQAILELSKKPFFKELEFRMIGRGKLFDEVLEPVRKFDNVIIEERFLTRQEIAEIHKEYGVFLCPTRMDTQGVSRDEAMSSGLVPITNAVAAVPEFVDETCGMLVEAEDAKGLAAAIEKLYHDPELFKRLSEAAARRVRRQSAKDIVINKEIELFTSSKKSKKEKHDP